MLPDLQSAVICEDVRCEVNGMQTLVGVLSVIPAPVIAYQLFSALHLDPLVQRFRQISPKISPRRRGRTAGSRAGGGRVCAQRDGRPRDQCPLFWRRAVSTVRDASRRDLPGQRIAAALSVAGDSGAAAASAWLNSATSHERGLVNGLNRLSGGIMLKRFFASSTLQRHSHRENTCAGSNRCPRKKTRASHANTAAF